MYDTFDEWIHDSLANCAPFFQLFIIAETDKERLVWPIWLDYNYINGSPKQLIFEFLAYIVKIEKGIDLCMS